MVIKRVGVLSVGKVMGCLNALFGLIAGAFMSLMAVAGVAMQNQQGMGPGAGPGMMPGIAVGAAAIILLPILYGVIGFVGGIISAAVYNVLASIVGGIELELGAAEDQAPAY
jgi:hypothetical protein